MADNVTTFVEGIMRWLPRRLTLPATSAQVPALRYQRSGLFRTQILQGEVGREKLRKMCVRMVVDVRACRPLQRASSRHGVYLRCDSWWAFFFTGVPCLLLPASTFDVPLCCQMGYIPRIIHLCLNVFKNMWQNQGCQPVVNAVASSNWQINIDQNWCVSHKHNADYW